jgi:hypothetical protein
MKLIAILVLSSTLCVAVETDTDYVEHAFSNSEAGAKELISFAEEAVGDPEGGVRLVVGRIDDSANELHIVSALGDLGVKHGLAEAEDVKAAVAELGLGAPSARAVAAADEKRFGFLYRRKR